MFVSKCVLLYASCVPVTIILNYKSHLSDVSAKRGELARKTRWRWSEVAQSCPTLCDPMDCSPPGSSLHGILQARILEWVAISFSRGSSRPRDWTRVSLIPGRRFNLWATREAQIKVMLNLTWVKNLLKTWGELGVGVEERIFKYLKRFCNNYIQLIKVSLHFKETKTRNHWWWILDDMLKKKKYIADF